ncbi:hypothetical protein EDB83DRAFT_2318241 [Lactarius deliciosus]|nr:hypothetical protein EDB83DRAFT_2318241 [Lactarius deliciosus]
MFTYAPRLVQRASPPVHERTQSQASSSVPRSHTPSLHPSPAVPIPTRHSQTPSPQSIPIVAPRHSPEPWVDALKEDVEAEFNLSLVDDVKAVKDASLASATTPEEKVAIQREFDESMADIRALARAELQRRVEAERERRLLGNFHGKDALVAEQHNIMDGILREKIRRDVSHSPPSSSSSSLPSHPAQPQPHLSRQSQPIPIPIQRNSSRNSVPRGSSVGGRSVSIGNGPIASSSSSSPRAFPPVHRDSITQHASARPSQSPVASPASSLPSVSSPSETSSVGSTHDKEVDRRYEEHRAAVQKREQEVQRKEAAALRYAEEARRREEVAARHEENARRKNEEATRRIREAELREQQVRAWEARTRKEIAQKEAEAARTRTRAQSTASAAVPRMTRVFSEEWQQQQQQKLRAGAGVAAIPTPIAVPRGEVKRRHWGSGGNAGLKNLELCLSSFRASCTQVVLETALPETDARRKREVWESGGWRAYRPCVRDEAAGLLELRGAKGALLYTLPSFFSFLLGSVRRCFSPTLYLSETV